MHCLVLLCLVLTFPASCSDVIKDHFFICTRAAIRSSLSVGAGYAMGRLFGHEHVGICVGALVIVASKECPYGIAREIGYFAPIALIGWYCYSGLRKQINLYRNDAIQRGARLDAMNNSCLEVNKKLQKLKQDAKQMVQQYSHEIHQTESTSSMLRSNSCPNLALKHANSFGQIAMNELY